MPPPPEVFMYTGARAWEVIWKWVWFTKPIWQDRFRQVKEPSQRALEWLLPSLGARSVLDCACGLGWKTIPIAEMGYEVEGSDRCGFAVERAAELAREEEGLAIRFFQSRWRDLGRTCGRRYDCVLHDAFSGIAQRRSLIACAKGAHAALNPRGKFIFVGEDQWSAKPGRAERLAEQWRLIEKENVPHCHERDGVKLLVQLSQTRTPHGILGHRIHIIDDHGRRRVEVATVRDPCMWGWSDYVAVLKEAGFRHVHSISRKVGPGTPYVLNVAGK